MVNREYAQKLWNNLLELGPRRLALLAFVGLAVFLGVGGGAYYLSRPEFNVLYSGLTREDVTRVSAVLRDANVPFDVNATGDTIHVRPGQAAHARTLLAEKGLPSSTSGGYELFDKIGSLGLTSFMQEITRVRALEGEIARTIQVIKGVKAARVHIVMPARGSFRREQLPPSASVVLRTDGPADARTARSVRHLVAAAVPGMTPDKVTVLDSDGSLLGSDDDGVGNAPTTLANLQRVVSRLIQENVTKALTPYLGMDNFQVSVATQLSTDKRQTNETVYDPDSRVQRSVRAVREKETSQSLDRQTPTTVQQNLPDQQNNSAAAKNSNDEKQRREDVTNYEVSSKTITTVSDGYAVNKMFLAVLVNRPRLAASLGDKVSKSAIEAKVAEIAQLAATAAGIDRPRGDQIQVSAVEFMEGARDLAPVPGVTFTEVMMRQSGSFVSALTILAVAGMLIWFGLRPAINTILAGSKSGESAQFTVGEGADLLGGDGSATAQLSNEGTPNLVQDISRNVQHAPERRLEQIVQLDEKQAAAILETMDPAGGASMSAEKVARLLTDFDRPEPARGRRVVPFDHSLHSNAKAQPKPPAAPPEDDAYQRGVSEGYAAARAEYEQKLNDETSRFSARLGEERHDLLNETAARIASEIAEVGNQLEAKIAGVTARILEPFISGAVQKQAVVSFVEKLSSLTSDSRRPALRITGPSELIELVRSKLGVRSISVELRAEPVAEVSVLVDQVVLETQMKIWADRLKFTVLA